MHHADDIDKFKFNNEDIMLLDNWRKFVRGMEFLDSESLKARTAMRRDNMAEILKGYDEVS